MTLYLAKEGLKFEEIPHHHEFDNPQGVLNIYQAEIFYYKSEEVTVRATIKIIEHNKPSPNYEVATHSYAHVHDKLALVEISDGKNVGEFNSLEEAKMAAQNYFNEHHHIHYHQPRHSS